MKESPRPGGQWVRCALALGRRLCLFVLSHLLLFSNFTYFITHMLEHLRNILFISKYTYIRNACSFFLIFIDQVYSQKRYETLPPTSSGSIFLFSQK